MRFSTTNLCTEDATTLVASSSNPNFPVSRLKNPHRSKSWRSSGTFVIDNLRNKVNFKEASLGSELTATVADGTYTPTTLAAALKAALELVGAETYTVTYSTATGLWTISTSGTYLQFLNLTGSDFGVSIIVNVLGFAQADTDGSTSHTGSRIAIHTSESVTFDFKTAQDIKNIVLLWPKEDGIKLSADASITIKANATNVWTAPAVNQVLTLNDTYEVASHFFATSQSYRYWQIEISDSQNPYLYIELGMIWVGEDEGFSDAQNGFTYTLNDPTVTQRTPFGQEYNDIYPQYGVLEFDYNYVYYADQVILENAFRENGSYKPVLCVFDETGTNFDKDHFLIYGTLDKSFKNSHIQQNYFKGGLKITELG